MTVSHGESISVINKIRSEKQMIRKIPRAGSGFFLIIDYLFSGVFASAAHSEAEPGRRSLLR
jgi:hypothetical protein